MTTAEQQTTFDLETDYCVVGAGSAGCVIASHLSERSTIHVMLLEAGPKDVNPLVHIPAGYFHLQGNPNLNWLYTTDPLDHPLGRTIRCSAGKMLGGSSSLNGIIFARGQRTEFDAWRRTGCTTWDYDSLLPYFKKSECFEGGEDDQRGGGGPVPSHFFRTVPQLTKDFVLAANEAGYPTHADMNTRQGEGVSLFQQNRRGRFRVSAARAYLRLAKRRKNLTVITSAICSRVLFDGKRAIGVEFGQRGRKSTVRAHKEVIVCCGAFRSPHLLQLSGVGDTEHLEPLGIAPIADLPGVGRGLCDQFLVRVQHRVKKAATINQSAGGARLIVELVKYLVANRGLLTLGASQAAIYAKSGAEAEFPDIQMMFAPVLLSKTAGLENEAGMTIGTWVSNPYSRGTVMARSPDPNVDPVIRPGYLSDDRDWPRLFAAIRHARKVFAAPSLARWSIGESAPGASVVSDEDLYRFALETGESGAQVCATCKMGNGREAVVDERLRVRGVTGLRIVDASVFPTPVSGGLHANVIAVAEKAAALILEGAS